jgi:hypothetical protein
MSFLLSLMFSLQPKGEEGRTSSAWKQGGWTERGAGAEGRDGPNSVYTYE